MKKQPINVFDLLKKYKIVPNRSAGQNFLVDQKVLNLIVKIAQLKNTDNVLEVGAGLGVLTQELVNAAKRVLAVELDRSLFFVLKKQFKDFNNKKLILIRDDILKVDIRQIKKIFNGAPYKIVANIPYNITSIFLRQFLSGDYPPSEMILLVQKQVAERIVAKPGKMSLLSLATQFQSEPQLVAVISAKSFFPAPKVDSAIIKLKTKAKAKIDEKRFFQLARIGFSAKRKKLENNLANGLKISKNEAADLLVKAGLKPNVRAQELSLGEWVKLSEISK